MTTGSLSTRPSTVRGDCACTVTRKTRPGPSHTEKTLPAEPSSAGRVSLMALRMDVWAYPPAAGRSRTIRARSATL